METGIRLIRLTEERTIAFKEEMQEAFEKGFQGHIKDDVDNSNQWQVLPDGDFYQALQAEGAEAYEAVDAEGRRMGGAIINIAGEVAGGKGMAMGLSLAYNSLNNTTGTYLKNNALTLQVGVDDLLNGSKVRVTNKVPTLNYSVYLKNQTRQVWCRLTYNFSTKTKTNKNRIQNDNSIKNRL